MPAKTAIVLTVAALLVLPTAAGAAAPVNLFTNPSFELGRDGWRMDKGKGTVADFRVDEADAADGSRSALVTIDKVGEWGTQFGQSFDAAPKGKTLTFAVLARSAAGAVQVQLEIERRADPYDRAVRSDKVALTPDKWAEVHVTFKVQKDYPEGWFAYLSCTQPDARYRADGFRLYEGPYVPFKEAAKEEAAGAAVRLYDTGAPATGPLPPDALARRQGWTELAEADASHAFKGDAVLANSAIALVLRRGAPGAEVYAVGPGGLTPRAVLAPAAASAVRIEAVKVAEHGPGGAAANRHSRPEQPRCHVQPLAAKGGHECLVNRLGLLGRSGVGKCRPAPAAGVGQQGEIRDRQNAPPSVPDGHVQLALLVLEDSKVGDLRGEPFRVRPRVVHADGHVHQQPRLDPPDVPPVGHHLGPSHPLNECTHGQALPSYRASVRRAMEATFLASLPGEKTFTWSP